MKQLRSPARSLVSFSNNLYVMLEDGSIWKWDGNESWELIAECLLQMLDNTIKELNK